MGSEEQTVIYLFGTLSEGETKALLSAKLLNFL
jgi:hypothetical protein